MTRKPTDELRRGWTTGACATAATKAALMALWGKKTPTSVTILLPQGQTPTFELRSLRRGSDWAEASIIKDAGDDPDVTHNAQIVARVSMHAGIGVRFVAGDGVGTVTKPGLPIAVGEPAINPVPRQMMEAVVVEQSLLYEIPPQVIIEISVPGGRELAEKTWNPRLGIKGGISILGTTGIVRPFSCSAWIASIHRGIDVARAGGLDHVAACTGATSERVVQSKLDLPDHAMLDMGDFAGGVLKYLHKHPIPRLTLGGGFGKLTKFAQGAMDLHSGRSQVDFADLADRAEALGCDGEVVRRSNTALEALGHVPELALDVAHRARNVAARMVPNTTVDVIVVSRDGKIIGESG